MTITVPQGLAPEATAIAVATRVRWTYVAPTLLIYWIISMFDKSNISLVMADPKFLDEMQLNGQAQLLGWLASSMFISYSLAAPLWGWAVTRYGPRYATMASLVIWGLTCFWSALSASYGMLLTSRIGLGVGEAACYPVTLALVANWFALPSIRPKPTLLSRAQSNTTMMRPGEFLRALRAFGAIIASG
jgi:MFS family permease